MAVSSGTTFHFSLFTALLVGCLLTVSSVRPASAQETGTPAFHAPYRSFVRHELGVTASFERGSQTGVEGHYRRGFGPVDVAMRAGIVVRENVQDSFLVGLSGRVPLLAEEQFPLRGALVVGAGLDVSGGVSLWVPIGLSLGRRLNVEKSEVSLVPYVQPTLYYTSAGSELAAGLGAGLDLRLSSAFEVRVSGGFGTGGAPEGVAVSAAWLR